MVIKKQSWHVKLYILAWLFDRAWFEWLVIPNPAAREETELDREYRAVCRRIDQLYQGWDIAAAAERAEIQERVKPFAATRDELRKRVNLLNKYWVLRIVAKRRIDDKRQFNADKLALCPYFWSVAIAIVVYLPLKAIGWVTKKMQTLVATVSVTAARVIAWPFVKIGTWLGERIRRNQEMIRRVLGMIGTGAGKLAKVALLLTVGYASYGLTNYAMDSAEAWRVDNERTLMAQAEANQYRLTWAPFEEARRLASEREYAARMAADARRVAEAAKYVPSTEEIEWQAHRAKINAAQETLWAVQREKSDAIYTARKTMWHIEDNIGTYAAWGKFFQILALLCAALFVLAPAVTFFRRKVWTHAKVQATRASTASGWESFSRWCAETYELAAAFAKARKEQVCPYIHFVDDEQTAKKH